MKTISYLCSLPTPSSFFIVALDWLNSSLISFQGLIFLCKNSENHAPILFMFSFSDPIFPESGEAALCEIVAGGSNQSECRDCSNTDFKHTQNIKTKKHQSTIKLKIKTHI